jgi:predicted RNA binding protein YcfA (HicA-like mRNA interferase family)
MFCDLLRDPERLGQELLDGFIEAGTLLTGSFLDKAVQWVFKPMDSYGSHDSLLLLRSIEPIADLEKAGFINRGGKGSHRNYYHEKGVAITISGKPGDDAKPYQEKVVEQKMREIS